MKKVVPFKTPSDYFVQALGGDPANIDRWHEIQKTIQGWDNYDTDLHIYPYTSAVPAMLSMGCAATCKFCPTAEIHKGRVWQGDPEKILPHYEGMNVHFMDEDFFSNDMRTILPLLKRYRITWLAMTRNIPFLRALGEYGEDALYDAGLRIVEVGLENVVHYMKCRTTAQTSRVAVYYLNMSFFPGETKESLQENAKWMKEHSLERPIHHNNGLWYAPGQYLYPYGKEAEHGIETDSLFARTVPSYVPDSLLDQSFEISDLEKANYYSQLVYGFKLYNPRAGSIREFVGTDHKKAMWLAVGLRCGALT